MKLAVAGVLRRDGQALLCRRVADRGLFPAVWDLPGGHVEAGEDPANALVRELHEELGVEVERPTGPPFMRGTSDGYEVSVWIVDDWSGTVHNRAPLEHDALTWVGVDEASKLTLVNAGLLGLLTDVLVPDPSGR